MTNDKPALVAAFVVAGGIFAAGYYNVPWEIWAIGAILLLIFSLAKLFFAKNLSAREHLHSVLFLALLCVSAGASFSIQHQIKDQTHISKYLDTTDSLTILCKVVDEPKIIGGKTRALVSVVSVSNPFDSIEVVGRAYLTIYPDKRANEKPFKLHYGSFLVFRGLLQSPTDTRNPGEFSYKEYLILNDIYAVISVFGNSDVRVLPRREPNFFFEHIIFPSKNFVTQTVKTVMHGDEANFLIGLLLGDRTEISEEIKKAFMNTGTIHVLAVSGSHVILVVMIIYTIFGLLRFSHKAKIIATIVGILYYMFLTGATPSIVRATLMTTVVLLGKLFEERVNTYNALGVSAIILLLFDPKQLFDVGFQLSFSAVFSIVYFYPKLNALIPKIPESLEELKIVSWIWKAFAVSVAAQIGTIPFTALYFGKVSLVSFAANLFIVPLTGLIVTIGLTGALIGMASLFIASCFSEVNNIIAVVTLSLVKLAEQAPLATVNTATFGFKETILYSAIIGYVFNLNDLIIRKRIIFIVMIAGNVFLYQSIFSERTSQLRITFLDVGQGDGAVIQFPSGEVIVVDAGPKTLTFDAGEKIVASFLRKNGIERIDAIMMSHPHADHLGGVPYLLKHFAVETTIDQNQKADSRLFHEYDSLKQKLHSIVVTGGMELARIPNVRLYALHPTKQFLDSDSSNGYSNLNETSVVFKLVYGKTSFLFTGDAEVPAEEHMTGVYGDFLDSDVLKAGHHGSITSSSDEFLSNVTPKEVVISVGKFNKFRHPSKIVLERFTTMKANIHRTDQEGAIIFESNGNSVRKIEWKKE